MAIDQWRDIEGWNGAYQVSYQGNVRRIYRTRGPRPLKPYIRRQGNSERLAVTFNLLGVKKEYFVHLLVAETWLPKKMPNEVAYHVNGVLTDNWSCNIAYIDRSKLGTKTGGKARAKVVAKIDTEGETVEVYSSAKKACEANDVDYEFVRQRCRGNVREPFMFSPYTYAWEGCVKSMNNALNEVRAHRSKMGMVSIHIERVKQDA